MPVPERGHEDQCRVTPCAAPKRASAYAGGVGVVDHPDRPAECLAQQAVDVGADPGLVDVGGGPGDAVLDHRGEGDADRARRRRLAEGATISPTTPATAAGVEGDGRRRSGAGRPRRSPVVGRPGSP